MYGRTDGLKKHNARHAANPVGDTHDDKKQDAGTTPLVDTSSAIVGRRSDAETPRCVNAVTRCCGVVGAVALSDVEAKHRANCHDIGLTPSSPVVAGGCSLDAVQYACQPRAQPAA